MLAATATQILLKTCPCRQIPTLVILKSHAQRWVKTSTFQAGSNIALPSLTSPTVVQQPGRDISKGGGLLFSRRILPTIWQFPELENTNSEVLKSSSLEYGWSFYFIRWKADWSPPTYFPLHSRRSDKTFPFRALNHW